MHASSLCTSLLQNATMYRTRSFYMGLLSLVVVLSSLDTVFSRRSARTESSEEDRSHRQPAYGRIKCHPHAVVNETCTNTAVLYEPVGICLPRNHSHSLQYYPLVSSPPGLSNRLICVPPMPTSCGATPFTMYGTWEPEGAGVAGDFARLNCSDGYEDKSCGLLFCQDDGNWTTSSSSCDPINCGNPPFAENGYFNVTNTTYGSGVFSITCYGGFADTNAVTLECDASGTWNTSGLGCTPDGNSTDCGPSVSCDPLVPLKVSHGQVEWIVMSDDPSNPVAGDWAKLECVPFDICYDSNRPNIYSACGLARCQEDGTWTDITRFSCDL